MIPSLTLFMRGVLETSYTIQAITIALVFSLELGSKTLLLEALHTLLTIHGEVKLVLTRKFLSFAKMLFRVLTEKGYQQSYPAMTTVRYNND